jgi:hypothetical protein
MEKGWPKVGDEVSADDVVVDDMELLADDVAVDDALVVIVVEPAALS